MDNQNEQNSNTPGHAPPTSTGEHRIAGAPILGLDRRTPLMRIDLTINIPTILALVASVVSIAATGITLYYGMDRRMLGIEFEQAKLTQRVEKAEGAISAVRADQSAANSMLRSEMKGDLAEIKGQLNQLIFNPPATQNARGNTAPPQQQLNEWRK